MVVIAHNRKFNNHRSRGPRAIASSNSISLDSQQQKQRRVRTEPTRPQDRRKKSVNLAHAANRAKQPLWALIAKQTADIVLGDGRYIETRRIPVSPALADLLEKMQRTPVPSTRIWHLVHDISAQVRSSVSGTTFYPSTQVIERHAPSAQYPTTFEFSKHTTPAVARRLYLTGTAIDRSTTSSSHPTTIGVLACTSGRRPGSGALGGSSSYDSVLLRTTSLIASHSSSTARPFYTAIKADIKQQTSLPATQFPIAPILYSPGVVGLRRADDDNFNPSDDDFDGERDAVPADPTTRDLENPPAVNGQNQRAMGEYASPYVMNVVSLSPVPSNILRASPGVVDDGTALAHRIRTITKPRIARALSVFAARGDRTLVLGTFGCDEGVPADILGQIYAELLACAPEGDETTSYCGMFEKIVFAVPGKFYSPFKKAFEMRVYEDELVKALSE